jgi:ribosomal protein S18 acetylase RimI-like enzyme|tara:strand:- start:1362 stop:1775 length:414 start_codon:yes stop_codon:yes gene_type:complete
MDIRPLNIDDLQFLLEVRNNESTRYNLENDNIFTLKECQNWFGKLKSPWYIIEVMGLNVGYIRTNGDEIGCDIHPNFRRKGYARMAYEIYLKDKKYATLKVFDDNFAKNLYKKLGFTSTGDSENIRGRNYIKMEYYG